MSESILPKTSQQAGREHRLPSLHPSSLLEFEFVEGEVPGHEEVTHDSSRALEESKEEAEQQILGDTTSPDLRLCGAHVKVVQEQMDAVPWFCSSPGDRATASRL